MFENIYTIFTVIFMIIIVVFMAYIATIIIGKKSSIYYQGRTVKVLERTALTAQLSIIVIQVIDKVHVIAVHGKSIEMIETMSFTEWFQHKKNNEQSDEKQFFSFFKKPFNLAKNPLTIKSTKSNHIKGDRNRNHEDE